MDWINTDSFYVYGQTGYPSDIFQVYVTNDDYKTIISEPTYLLMGRKFSVSPNHLRVVYCNLITNFMNAEYLTDSVLIHDLSKKRAFKEREFRDAQAYVVDLYPGYEAPTITKSSSGERILTNRHEIMSELLWIGNDKIVFVDNYHRKSRLIKIGIFSIDDKKFSNSIGELKNLYDNITNLKFDGNKLLIEGTENKSKKKVNETTLII